MITYRRTMSEENKYSQGQHTPELRNSKEFLKAIIDNSLDIIQVFKAVRNKQGEIVDFEWIANNRQAIEQNGDVVGKTILEVNPGVVPTGIFDHMVRVTLSGLPWEHEKYYSHEQFSDKWFYQAIVKHDDGVLMTTRDITNQKLSELEILRLKEELADNATNKYLSLFNSIDEGFCIIEVLFDKNSKPFDYRFLEANSAFEKQTGLTGAIGKTIKEMAPDHEQYWFDIYGRIAITGKAERFENAAKAIGHYYNVYAFRIDDPLEHHVAVLFSDITERRKEEERKAYILKLSDAVRTVSDTAEIKRIAMRLAGEALRVDRVLYADLDEADKHYIINDNYVSEGFEKMLGRFPVSAFGMASERLVNGQVVVIGDIAKEILDENARKTFFNLGVHATFAIPLIKNGKLRAVMGVQHGATRNWSRDEIGLLHETAERTWAAVERAKAEASLHVSEERNRIILESAGMAS